MKNLKSNWEFILFLVLIMGFSGGIAYVYNKQSKECDTVVFIEGRLSVDARRVNHYSNGFTSIEFCDGRTEVYHSSKIIKVIEK